MGLPGGVARTVNLIGVQAPCSLNLNDFIPLGDKISHGKIANLSAVTLKIPRERSSIKRCQEDAFMIVTNCCDARTLDVEDNDGTKRLTLISVLTLRRFSLAMVIITRCDTITIPSLLQTQALICWRRSLYPSLGSSRAER